MNGAPNSQEIRRPLFAHYKWARTCLQEFQLSQVVTAAESRARKRCRFRRESWPKLAAGLGDRFETHFRTFASENHNPPRDRG